MSVNSALLSMKKLNEEAYKLDVQFHSNSGKLHSTKQFIFTHQQSGLEKELIDVYSLNSICSLPPNEVSGIFNNKDIKCIKKVIPKMEGKSSVSTILTLDIKGRFKGYLDPEVPQKEWSFCEFFSKKTKTSSKSATTAQRLLQNKLDYVFCEGSFKAEILKKFEESQSEYLNSSTGANLYCQLTEVFMNAAKFGHLNAEIASEPFIFSVSKMTCFQPYTTSTIWYPALYKESSKEVAKMFSPVFPSEVAYDESTGITTFTMKEPL